MTPELAVLDALREGREGEEVFAVEAGWTLGEAGVEEVDCKTRAPSIYSSVRIVLAFFHCVGDMYDV